MARIPKWARIDGCRDSDVEELCCPNGSFTCGLLTALNKKGRCISCRKEEEK